jgi:hypothetical protein
VLLGGREAVLIWCVWLAAFSPTALVRLKASASFWLEEIRKIRNKEVVLYLRGALSNSLSDDVGWLRIGEGRADALLSYFSYFF